MFCLITASKLSSQYFKVKVMRLKPDYLLKSFLLYSKCETLFVAPNAYWADNISLSLDILLLRGVNARPCFCLQAWCRKHVRRHPRPCDGLKQGPVLTPRNNRLSIGYVLQQDIFWKSCPWLIWAPSSCERIESLEEMKNKLRLVNAKFQCHRQELTAF